MKPEYSSFASYSPPRLIYGRISPIPALLKKVVQTATAQELEVAEDHVFRVFRGGTFP